MKERFCPLCKGLDARGSTQRTLRPAFDSQLAALSREPNELATARLSLHNSGVSVGVGPQVLTLYGAEKNERCYM